jgi:hypothetical protein
VGLLGGRGAWSVTPNPAVATKETADEQQKTRIREIRNPNIEIRNKFKMGPRSNQQTKRATRLSALVFGFFRVVSDFGFRICIRVHLFIRG